MFSRIAGKIFLALLLAVVVIPPALVLAKIGVGVGVGKIQVDEILKAGQVYRLPNLPVLNTGDEPADYESSVEFHEGIPELRPAREWFSFSPQTFHLEPGEVQSVQVMLTLPLKTQPGDYFAYLEGHPVEKTEAGVTSVGIAAAAKLYFTVAPANIFQGIYYRVITTFQAYGPWSYIILGILVGAFLIILFRKHFSLNIAIRAKR